MSYCLNPACHQPQNPDDAQLCQNCGTSLVLREHFRPLRKIGQGGFGRTFLAVDEDLPSQPYCVIKQFYPQGQESSAIAKAFELFRQEALRLDDLGKYHEQIPKLIAYFSQDSRQYLVQEYIDGNNLAQELERKGAFSESDILQLLHNLLPVLQFIHSNQIIHRDIKPENIICRSAPQSSLQSRMNATRLYSSGFGGQLVLVDFGAAKFATEAALAATQTKIGDFRYIAPEQAIGRATYASDIYSLGVTCIHLLTNIPATDLFDNGEADWVWQQYLGAPISLELQYILNKMLEYGTKRRYANVDEVLADVQAVAKERWCAVKPPSLLQTATQIAVANFQNSQLELSSQRDYTLIIDKSDSMSGEINEPGSCRWEEAQKTTLSLTRQWESLSPEGITVYFFWSLFKRYHAVKSCHIPQLFQENQPFGSTDLAWVLQAAVKDYFRRKAKGEVQSGGETIVVLTDGEPNDGLAVRRVIQETYGWTQQTNELSFLFVQVGNDSQATQFLQQLSAGVKNNDDFCRVMTSEEISQSLIAFA